MSILIKGMKMPKSCIECMFYRAHSMDYDYCCISSATPKGYVPADCPLVDLPDHGDLIDRDIVWSNMVQTESFQEAQIALWNACVIIPAERSEE